MRTIYDEIQASQTVKLFTSTRRTVDFEGTTYNTGLDEIYNMILSYMLTIMNENSTAIS